MYNNKKINNQSNSNSVIPSNEEILKMGFKEANFDILSDYSKKAYKFENESKQDILDKYFSRSKVIVIPMKNEGVIRIGDYNVHDWVTLFKNYDKKRDLNNFLTFFKLLDADVLCLQEVIPLLNTEIKEDTKLSQVKNDYNFKYIVSKMKEIGYKYSAIANNIRKETLYKFPPEQYYVLANAIFSKNKFEKEIYHLTGNRSAVIAYFESSNFNYIVVNTHLEYSRKNFDENRMKKELNIDDIRIQQVKELLSLIDYSSQKYNTKNVFLSGDLNSPYISKVLKDIFKKFVSLKMTKKTNLYGNNSTDFICPSRDTMKNIFIFEYEGIDAKLSDHLPIYLDFVPNLIENKSLINNLKIKSNVIRIDKYNINFDFINPISNSVTDYILFNYSDEVVKQYYLNIKSWYYNPNLKPMFELDKYDFKSLLKKLIGVNDYYKNYIPYVEMFQSNPITIDKKMDKHRIYIEDMLLQFVKCRPEMKVITIWPAITFEEHSKEFISVLRENGNIYYAKEIYLDYWGAMSLMFQIYATTDRNKTMSHLDYNVKQKGWNTSKEDEKRVIAIFYEYTNKNKAEISGSESEFKTKLRSFWKTEDKRPYDILHINDYFQETIDYASLYLNENSIKILKKQNIKNFIKISSFKELVYINTLKKTMYENFQQSDIIRFIFLSSIVLYIYGLRKCNDIDGLIYPSNKKDLTFNQIYNQLFDITSSSFIPFLDISYKDSKAWQDYILAFYNKVSFMYNKINYEQVIFNPKYHFYFFGIKCHLIEFEIIKRIYRFKPSSLADLIMIKEKLNYPIVIPKIPEKIKYYYKNKINKNELIDTILYYLRKNYFVKKTKEDIEKIISSNEITTNIDDKNINKNVKFFNKIFGKKLL